MNGIGFQNKNIVTIFKTRPPIKAVMYLKKSLQLENQFYTAKSIFKP